MNNNKFKLHSQVKVRYQSSASRCRYLVIFNIYRIHADFDSPINISICPHFSL